MTRKILSVALLSLALFAAGCASRTKVLFESPARTQMYLPNQKDAVVMPVTLTLPQTDDPEKANIDLGGRPIRLVLPTGIKLKGFLYVYKSPLDNQEISLIYRFGLTEEQINKVSQGQAVTVTGSSSKHKPVFKVTLGRDME